jgi:hypothetical protein
MISDKQHLIKQLKRRLKLHPLRLAAINALPNLAEQALSSPWVENQWLWPRYQAYLRQHEAHKPPLTHTDRTVVEQLNDTGRSITHLDELGIPGQASFWLAGSQLFTTLAAITGSDQHEFQTVPDFSLLKAHRQVFQWGVSERLLAIAENYIGLPIAYDTCLCNISLNNGLETATRRWHLDCEDRCVLKVIIYFNDVVAGGGPFQFLDLASSTQLLAAVGYHRTFLNSQALDQRLQSMASTAAPQTCTGPAGTVIFVDTAKLYHRGQPPVHQARQAITFGYYSRRPLRPFCCHRNQLNRSQLSQLATLIG